MFWKSSSFHNLFVSSINAVRFAISENGRKIMWNDANKQTDKRDVGFANNAAKQKIKILNLIGVLISEPCQKIEFDEC